MVAAVCLFCACSSDDDEDDEDTSYSDTTVEVPNKRNTYSVKIEWNGKVFSRSLNEKIAALSELVNETYSDSDNDYYVCDVFEDNGYVNMFGIWSGKSYRQTYKVDGDKYTLTGDRIETFSRWLTQEEIDKLDSMSEKIHLAKGHTDLPGKGVYPEDLTKEEFHKILTKMLNEGKDEEVKKILTQRSVVERNGDELVGIDYIDKFQEDFAQMADELDKAAETSTNKEFTKYLVLQAQALRMANPMLDAYADKQWATLQDTPLEFTITRENYEDEMTGTIVENKELSKMLEERGISPIPKDFLGGRVGIVNKKGTDALMAIKKYLPTLADNMPYKDEYEQNISTKGDAKQTMVDVDLVAVTGNVGEYRGGITLAENLPNDDKLSLKIGGGRRNVYHRQIRFISDKAKLQERLDAILDKDQQKYYLDEADHWFTIGHENAHSLGPKKAGESLGKYRNIIEENKADMGSLAFVDLLTELGMYTPEQRKQIIVTTITDNFLKSKPTLSQAHRVRTVMQNKYFAERGAYEITPDGKIHVNIDKVVPIAKEMLAEIVRIQIDGDFDKAEKYVKDNFVWTDNMELIAQKLQKVNKTLNGRTESELAEKLLAE